VEYLLHRADHMKIRNLAFAVLLLLAPAVFAADFGIRAGRYNDAGENFVGAEVVIDAGVVNINPNIEYSLQEDITAGSANLDVTFDLGRFNSITPYLGAGVGLQYVDDDFGTDETDVLGNLIGGVQFDFDFLKPYAQVKYSRTIEDDDTDEIALTIGLRF
jgi:opacity protein-like surface antigen